MDECAVCGLCIMYACMPVYVMHINTAARPNSERASKRSLGAMRKMVDRLAVRDVERRLDNMV